MPAAARAWILGALAAVLSFAFSWVPSYWSDEVASVRASRLAPAELLPFTMRHVDAGHTVYYVALHYWSGLFGFGEPAMRGFSAIGVGVAVAFAALIGQRLGRPRLGLFAAALLAVMPRMTWAGTEARSYAWTAALAAAAWLLLLIALDRGGWWWVALGAVAAIGVATFLLVSTLLLAQLLYALVVPGRRRAWLPLLAAWLAALAAAAPVLYLGWRERAQIAWIGPKNAFTPWTVLAEPSGETSWAYSFAVWVLLAAGAFRWRHALRRVCPEWLLLAGCWVVVPFTLTIAVSLVGDPVFTSRYLTFAMPGLAMAVAAALAALGARRLVAGATITLLAVSVPAYIGQRQPFAKPRESDLRLVAETVRDHARPGDAILFAPGLARESLYAYPQDYDGLVDVALQARFPVSGRFQDTTVPLSERSLQLAGIRSLVLVMPGHRGCERQKDAASLLGHGFAESGRFPTHNETVCRFTRTDNAS
ncbi:glycosyltransferase family 39 protein [Gryllotalpicola protaetiae]|uniref:Glycosyltransferase RgtA/B/C/D-like domain-containing protein n=1 Tax=Gryllotalpicola protaetiae TaxID=2419771 RepID=A0A387BP67_9MICO|nr:glycosyltransferase family 39 protein [Gryllotalpicola protaetiae]AYG02919.1 hypothetical protein D7I44_04860 [Gryllotalpicola protaetiae]